MEAPICADCGDPKTLITLRTDSFGERNTRVDKTWKCTNPECRTVNSW